MVENGTIKKTPIINNVLKCLFKNAMGITIHWELKVVSGFTDFSSARLYGLPLYMQTAAWVGTNRTDCNPTNSDLLCRRVFCLTLVSITKPLIHFLSPEPSFFLFEGGRKGRMSRMNPPKQHCGPPIISTLAKSIGVTPSLIAAATIGNTHAANIMATRNPKIASGFLPVVGSVATLPTDTHSI